MLWPFSYLRPNRCLENLISIFSFYGSLEPPLILMCTFVAEQGRFEGWNPLCVAKNYYFFGLHSRQPLHPPPGPWYIIQLYLVNINYENQLLTVIKISHYSLTLIGNQQMISINQPIINGNQSIFFNNPLGFSWLIILTNVLHMIRTHFIS